MICSQVMLVPQASLYSKLKGKTLTYRELADKQLSLELYQDFVTQVQCYFESTSQRGDLAAQFQAGQRAVELKSAIQPELMFQQGDYEGCYGSYDERGVPLTNKDGEPLAKAALKKLEKIHSAQVKRHARRAGGAGVQTAQPSKTGSPTRKESSKPEGSKLYVVSGVFGNCQSLKLEAECGPFTHQFDI
eukprot:TRINITY_DN4435_c0_g1_i2.p1 TRINITY_DN4435_c0_g1~~TRINITY_DN4435_c0_g1_i2.p1  ORF type:complete len:189 (-),score=40.48 TRINITY_DN4435_c0_g1_i2:287-853(-)